MASTDDQPWFLRSTYPVALPFHAAIHISADDFHSFVKQELISDHVGKHDGESSKATSDIGKVEESLQKVSMASEVLAEDKNDAETENKMATENGDMAYRSSKEALVDLFNDLEDTIDGKYMVKLLEKAWSKDAAATLKIIFNARSIHLGKSSRNTFYRAAGWLYRKHPATLISNLVWISRPIIEKKAEPKRDGDLTERAVFVERADADDKDLAHYDVRHGVSHGYWKDLLNILALAANDKLDPSAKPGEILNIDQRRNREFLTAGPAEAKAKRHKVRVSRYENVVSKLQNDARYRALHLAVARLFAQQLKVDLERLHDHEDPRAKHQISLCAKWAPSADRFHDKHTYVASTIAEILASERACCDGASDHRETFTRYAREDLRKHLSELRKQLDIVERKLSARDFGSIDYEGLPSLAMRSNLYAFVKNDEERFSEYTEKAASRLKRISGAVVPPSVMILSVHDYLRKGCGGQGKAGKVHKARQKITDAQWQTLVQRIRDSGTLKNCIAVCDVSYSMKFPCFSDKTRPIESAVALSLLVAEVAKPPFAGHFITFSTVPTLEKVDLSAPLSAKVSTLYRSFVSGSTDIVSVFQRLLLPMAIEQGVKAEDMVERVFVFSDMHFDMAEQSEDGVRWSSSFQRIEALYRDAGYELPELVFWNLAGGRDGDAAPKPVTADQEGVSMVSGYSQAMLKVFMDGGSFDEAVEDDELLEVSKTGEGDEDVEVASKRRKMNPMDVVNRAIRHRAYSMLKVVD